MAYLHAVLVALIFHVLDLILGLIGAVKDKNVKSSKMREGLFKKVGYLACYAVAWLLDTQGAAIGINLGVNVFPVVIAYGVISEVVSILENICVINPNLEKTSLMKLFSLTNKSKGDDDDEQ